MGCCWICFFGCRTFEYPLLAFGLRIGWKHFYLWREGGGRVGDWLGIIMCIIMVLSSYRLNQIILMKRFQEGPKKRIV